MHIEKLYIVNFKSFKSATLELKKGINCITGENGTGKTNLLDALYYLSFCKSYFNNIDSQNINDSEDFFLIKGRYHNHGQTEYLSCSLKRGEKKVFKKNDKAYQRLADHIGHFPLVIISPSDADYINAGSDMRRKYIDSALSQFDKRYLDNLLNYNKALQQRNILLKQFYERNYFDNAALEIWDNKLVMLGQKIYDTRHEFLKSYIPVFQDFHKRLSGNKEPVSVAYESQLKDSDYALKLKDAVGKDRQALHTTVGIHKDDLIFNIADKPLKKFGSQGQQKTFLIALKLAQYMIIKNIKKQTPLLLLDDIFDKLDNNRVEHLIKLVNEEGFEQIIITDTDYLRLQKTLEQIHLKATYFLIKDRCARQL